MGEFNHSYWVFVYDTLFLDDIQFYHVFDYPLIRKIFRNFDKKY